MLEKCKISGFADEIDSSFDVQLRVLKELGQKFLELRGADGVGVADFTMEKAAGPAIGSSLLTRGLISCCFRKTRSSF